MSETQAERRIAAVDLGSNSFHMIISGVDEQGNLRVLDKLRESVRLRGGLDQEMNLSPEVRQRALECLERFGERLRDFPSADVAAVGTNTLRQARKARRFLNEAEQALGHPIAVISGHEEARLIYLGVAHTLAEDGNGGKRFVMDIGGGSTELIIGQGLEAQYLQSLQMGCVSGSARYFPDGDLSESCWKKAAMAAHLELMPVQRSYRNIDWDSAIGASGTIKAIFRMIQQSGLDAYAITLEHMQLLQKQMQEAGHFSRLDIPGLSEERKPVIAGGLAILMSTFEALEIERMQVSEGALREGLVYDRLDRWQYGDLRAKTVKNLQNRFRIDVTHASQVRATAQQLFEACRDVWQLSPEMRELLGWAADLHELGLAVSHSGYQKHGGYLLRYMDLAGFSTEEQAWLSVLVRCHRRKLAEKLFEDLDSQYFSQAFYLAVLLRLAVLLHRSSNEIALPLQHIVAQKRELTLVFVGTEEQRPLLFADLEEEKACLKAMGMKLSFATEATV